MGPDELVRVSYMARRYYVEGRSKVEIAEEFGLSRFKVARMLDEAVSRGLVKITIEAPDSLDLDLSYQLRSRFGLSRALAVRTPSASPEIIQDRLGQAAAELLTEIVRDGDVLGLTAGRTLSSMAHHLQKLAVCEVVQLAGIAEPSIGNGVDVIRRVSQVAGGQARAIFAPLLVDSAATAASLRREPSIRETMRRFDSVTKAVVAIGSWNPPDSQLYDRAATSDLLDNLLAAGVQAEMCSTLLRADGSTVEALSERLIAIATEQLRKVPEVIAVAGGSLKTGAVLATLKSGIVTSLVTDTDLARRLLAGEPVASARSSEQPVRG